MVGHLERFKTTFRVLLVGFSAVSVLSALVPITPASAAATSATLSQCTNGSVGPPLAPEQCAGSSTAAILNGSANASGFKNWVNGNSNGQKSHWREGDFISYRAQVFAPAGPHTLQVHYDTVHSGGHAIDYLGNFDGTETTSASATPLNANYNNPCADDVYASPSLMNVSDCESGAPGATAATPSATKGAIPIANFTGADCSAGIAGTYAGTQIGGNVVVFGPSGSTVGTVSYVSQNVSSGSGQCTTTVAIAFNIGGPSNTSQNVVLAWGGHIATAHDWGVGNSASGINGSPYHMALDNLDGVTLGSQDRALATTAIFFPTTTTTQLSASTISVGASVSDAATVTGAAPTAGGTVTFSVFSNNTCTTLATTGAGGQISAQPGAASVTNNGSGTLTAHSAPVTFNQGGSYWWRAAYGGDSGTNSEPSTSACTSEPLTVASPVLSLTKVADQGTVDAGATIGYVLTISNSGSGTATGVTVTDTLPANNGLSWTIDAAGTTGTWSITAGVLSLASSSIAPSANLHVHITSPTTVATCGVVSNSASATSGNDGSPSAGPVTITLNCPTTVTTQLSATSISQGAGVSDQATISGFAPNAGGTITYKVFTNNTCTTLFADATPTTNTVVNGVAPASNPVTFNTGGTYYWQATYSGDAATHTLGSSSACTSEVLTVLAPNLSLTKTADAASVSAGDQIGYTITLTNSGPGTATNVAVSDTVPANAGLSWSIAAPSAGWTLSAGVLSFNAASFAPGSTSVHLISPTTSATCGTVNNSASATSTNDGNPSVGPVSIVVNCANLVLDKTADAASVSAGDPIGYTITVTNNGAGIARAATVSDTLPANAGLAWTIDAGGTTGAWSINAGVLSFGPLDIAAGASFHVHITSPTTAATCGTVKNSASATSTNDGNPSVGPVSIVVNCANLVLDKTADAASVSAGDPIGYTITVTNNGAGIARAATVSDTLPANAGLAWTIDAGGTTGAWSINAGVLRFGPLDIAAGASFHVHITSPTTAATCGTVNNSATATTSNDGSPTVGPVPITVNCANLSLTKTDDAASVSAGDQIGYTITVTNTGAGIARGATVSDTVPTNAGLSWSIDAAGTTGTWTLIGGTLSFGPQDVAAGASFHVHITSPTTTASCGTVSNSASATTTNDGNPTVGPVQITVNCANVTLAKTADSGTVSAGDPIGYTVTVSNTGAGIARSVEVSDTVPTNAGLNWSIDAGATTGTWTLSGGVLSFGPQDIAAGASFHVHITSPTTAATCGVVDNSAAATSTNDGDPTVGPIGITVNCPQIMLSKTADALEVSAGDQIGYTITVSNAGFGVARGATVSDTVPTNAGLSWSIDAGGTTGTWTLTGGTLSFGPQDIPAGGSFHVHITSPTTPATCGMVSNSASATTTNDGGANAGPVAITVDCPNLTINKTADARAVSAGDQIGYVITISNTGAGIARGVTESDTVPTTSGLSWSIDPAGTTGTWTLSGGTLSFGPQDLPAGASFHVHIISPTTAATCPAVANFAGASATNGGTVNVGPVTIQVECPSLTLTKAADAAEVSAGDTIGYTVTVTNSGFGIARGATVTDTVPTNHGLSWTIDTSHTTGTWNLTGGVLSFGPQDIAAGSSFSVHITSPTAAATCGTVNNSASATITNGSGANAGPVSIVVDCPLIGVSKIADAASVSAGDQIGYTITVSNSGAGIARGATVSDTVPTNAGLSWSVDAAGTTGTWTLTGGTLSFGPQDLAPNAIFHVHIISPTTPATCGTVNNMATAATTNDGGANSGNVPIVVNCANVTLAKTADSGTVSAGDPIGYVVTVSNTGAGIARSVEVSDTVPTNAGLNWSIDAGATTGTWTLSGGVLSFGPQDIAAGASVHVHITSPTTAVTCGVVDNSAAATSTNDGKPTVGPIGITVNCPQITLSKTADAPEVSAGQQIGYTITVSNTGFGIARNTTVTDGLPTAAGISWSIDASGTTGVWNLSGNSLTFGPQDLSSGDSFHVHLVSATSFASCGTLNNTATAATTNDGGASAGPVPIVIDCPNLGITKSADQPVVSTGDPIGFTVVVSNTGSGAASNVNVSDPLPSGGGVSWVLASQDGTACSVSGTAPSQSLSCALGNMAPGASYHVHITSATDATSAGTYSNTAKVTADNAPSEQATASVVVQPPALSITKTADAATVSTGDNIGFTVTVSNSGAAGTGTAKNVMVSDPLPSGSGVSWSINSQTSTLCSITGAAPAQSLSCALGDMAPGATYTVHITSTTNANSAGSYTNTATATPSNGTPVSATATTTVLAPALNVKKTPDAASVSTGTNIGFTITVSNSAVAGTGNAYNVMVSDSLPSGGGVSWFVDSDPSSHCSISGTAPTQTLNCSLGTLAPGASYTVHISSTTNASSGGTYTNTATATPSNGNPASGTGSLTVLTPNLALTKTADAGSVNPGSTIGYTVTISNSGPGTATGVTVTDVLPANGGLSWSIASQSGGTWSISGGTLSLAATTLAPGASATVHITSPTTSATCGTVNNSASALSSNDGSPSVGPISITVNCPTSVTTSLSGGAASGAKITVATGTAVSDQATISGAAPNASGTVTYQYTTDPTCTTGLISAGTASVVNGVAGPSNSITFNVGGTFYWIATYSGDPATDTGGSVSACGAEVLTVISPQVSQITPTQTTCTQFATGTAATLSGVFYATKGTTISSDNPGVMFYWVKVTVTSTGKQTFTINQSTTYSPSKGTPYFAVAAGSFAYDGSCNTLKTTLTGTAALLEVSFNATAPGTYFIGIKYTPKSIVGSGPAHTSASQGSYIYSFSTTSVTGSTSTIKLTHQ